MSSNADNLIRLRHLKRNENLPDKESDTLGDKPATVEKYQGPATRRLLAERISAAENKNAAAGGKRVIFASREDNSLGNVSRGDWTPIELFMQGITEFGSSACSTIMTSRLT